MTLSKSAAISGVSDGAAVTWKEKDAVGRAADEAAHKTGRAKADFELPEISREEYDRLSEFL
jgi:hypothetical protein